ncbi:porin [Paraburkholderia dipogonis]|uniref:Porin n=1 Tax=Paraburkholderia dipogonis TaxID=1211383 RepID=A0A4Y8MKR2_9BURK|nr:porin [Paraburkholderia dipogonis]TFE38066.1 porin [Paraburkholderia dipogonis]
MSKSETSKQQTIHHEQGYGKSSRRSIGRRPLSKTSMETIKMAIRNFPLNAGVVAAALCAAGAAQAQSSVTLYGIADAGLMYLSRTTPGANGTGRQFSVTNSGYSPSSLV